jgi:outer membrane lipoprotein-sorting protein
MKLSNNTEKLIVKLHHKPDKQTRDRIRNNIIDVIEKRKQTKSAKHKPNIWRIIMKTKVTKLAIAAAIIFVAFIVINQFGGSIDPATAAFAEIIENFKTASYSFDLTFEVGNASKTVEAKILQPGRMRMESAVGLGKVTSITDMRKGKSMILFDQFKTAQILQHDDLPDVDKSGGFLLLASRPVENLWNLLDGNEEYLGEKKIDGRKSVGFKTIGSGDDYFEYKYTIWADAETNYPVSVEIDGKATTGKKADNMKWRLNNFEFDEEFDAALFELELPLGYALAYQKNLEDVLGETEKSDQALRIEEALNLAAKNKVEKAAQLLLDIDFSKPITFPKEMYIFSLTEQELISLKSSDQKIVMPKLMNDLKNARLITNNLKKMAEANPDKSQSYYETALEVGNLLNNDPDRVLIAKMTGIAIQAIALKGLIPIYEQTGQGKKLDDALELDKSLKSQLQKIKDISSRL